MCCRKEGCVLFPCSLDADRWQTCFERLRGLIWLNLPLSPSTFSFQPVLSQTKLPTSSLKLSWEGSFGGLLSNVLLKAELTSAFDQVTGPCCIKFWKSPRTEVLQPALAPFQCCNTLIMKIYIFFSHQTF